MTEDFYKVYITESARTNEEILNQLYRVKNKNSLFDLKLRQKSFLFHHVAMTGGAVINDLFFRIQKESGVALILLGQEQAVSDNPPWLGKPTPFVMTAHHVFGLHERIAADSSYFGMMRDPYNYFVSKLLLDYQTEGNHMAGIWNNFERKIDRIRELAGHCNLQTYEHATYFKDKPLPIVAVENLEGTNPGDLFSRAVKNIENLFVFMGITELFEESIFALFDMMGIRKTLMWRPGLYTYWKPKKDDLPINIQKKMCSLIEADLELYHSNRQKLEDMLARSDFGEELIRYKKDARNPYNRLYNELSERFYVANNTFGPFSETIEKEFTHSQNLIENIRKLSSDFRQTRGVQATTQPAIQATGKKLRGKWANPGFVLETVRQRGLALEYVAESLTADREVVLEAVRQHGLALEYAAESLRADREVVLEAVRQHGLALEYAAESLRADREVALEAVRQHGLALEYAAESLRADREVVLEAVKRRGWALPYSAESLRADREVVLAAVKGDGLALQFATENLRGDREIVAEAIKRRGWALNHAAPSLQADREVVLAAVKRSGRSLDFAAPSLQADREVVLEAVRQHGLALEYAAENLRADRQVVMEAVKQDGSALSFAAEELRKDEKLKKTAMELPKSPISHMMEKIEKSEMSRITRDVVKAGVLYRLWKRWGGRKKT